MTGAWFSPELAESLRWLSFLSLLSLLSIYPVPQGRHRTAVLSIWMAALAVGVVCLGAVAVGLVVDQPGFVLRRLLAIGVALTLAFGLSFKPMLRAYQDAEIRRTIARDL